MNINYHKIIPGLYVGDMLAAKQPPNDVKRIINSAKELMNMSPIVSKENYLHVKLNDSDSFIDVIEFYKNIRQVIQFIDRICLLESPVLIHCQEGKSRSVSMVAAYLIHKKYCKSLDETVEFIQSIRNVAFMGPMNFRNALVEFSDNNL